MRRLLIAASALVLALAFVGAAAAGNGGFGPPTQQSPNGQHINDIYWLIMAISIAVFVIVEAALVVFIVRFRSRGRARSVEGPQITGNTQLEVIWTVIPVLLLIVIAVAVFWKLPEIKNVPSANAAGPRIDIHVEGRQFYWRFTYPNGAVSYDRMVAPAGRVVRLEVTSDDVIHSWYIPAFGGKIDAIPGNPNHTWFEVDKPGTYKGQCAELCGVQHALMLARVDVVPQADYDSWVAAQLVKSTRASAELGNEMVDGVCSKCHFFKSSGEKLIGPNLTPGTTTLTDHIALAKLVREGQNKMPPVGRGWSEAEVQSLVDYFKQQGSQGGG